jgi:hypothetical protein
MSLFRYALFASLIAVSPVLAQTGATSNTKPADTSPQPLAVGVRWSYQNRDELTDEIKGMYTYIVTDVSDKDVGVRLEVVGKPGFGYLTYDRAWNLVTDGEWNYLPNDHTGVQLPLAVGNAWAFDYNRVLRSRGYTLRVNGDSKVLAQEKVTTEAGTFDTFKIETQYAQRDANDPSKVYDFTLTTWYAPAVDHWVKREQKIRFEGHLRESNLFELLEYDSAR